jgi:3,4-dihydroxy-2-butanone 4-phosphate synthase
MTYVPVTDALARLRRGEMVIVTDDEDRENEGDLTVAAQFVTAETIAFMLRHARGLICLPVNGARLDALGIGAMTGVATGDTAFTVTVDHRSVGSGISAADRTRTIRAILDPRSRPADFVRPGHVFPLRPRDGGVLERTGHTEASVDLTRLAGLYPAAVICEVLNDDGTVAQHDDLVRLARDHRLALVSVADLVALRRTLVEPVPVRPAASW